MSIEETASYYKKIVDYVGEKEGIRKCKGEITPRACKGDNFLGKITAITIKGEDKQGDEKVLNLIVKTCSTNEKLRKEIMLRKSYEVEICMYEKIFPTFEQFQKERGVRKEAFKSTIRCFYTSLSPLHETLVFEDLNASGYKQWDMKMYMEPQHVAFILKEYGKFHAVSFALRDQNKKVFDSFAIDSVDVYEKIWWNLVQRNFGRVVAFFRDNEPEKEYLRGIEREIAIFFGESIKFGEYTAITHGDCWCNNMMFKYSSIDGSLEEMRFLDFQLGRKSNPIFDATHFFYCNASKDIYANVDYYVKIYYDSFAKHLKDLGSDPETMYPWKVFQEHWKIFSKRALTIAMVVLKMALTEQNEIPDMAQAQRDGKSAFDAFNYKITNENTYVERIKDLVTHMMTRNY